MHLHFTNFALHLTVFGAGCQAITTRSKPHEAHAATHCGVRWAGDIGVFGVKTGVPALKPVGWRNWIVLKINHTKYSEKIFLCVHSDKICLCELDKIIHWSTQHQHVETITKMNLMYSCIEGGRIVRCRLTAVVGGLERMFINQFVRKLEWISGTEWPHNKLCNR